MAKPAAECFHVGLNHDDQVRVVDNCFQEIRPSTSSRKMTSHSLPYSQPFPL